MGCAGWKYFSDYEHPDGAHTLEIPAYLADTLRELAGLIEYNGEPLGCHMTMATGNARERGLAGPSGEIIRHGNPIATNISYWGNNSCRAGWIAASNHDLPSKTRDYVENFAGKYFEVMAEWFGLLKIGTCGHDLAQLVSKKLPFGQCGIFLNPGHLIHLDEWVSSPVYPNSNVRLHSGMAILQWNNNWRINECPR